MPYRDPTAARLANRERQRRHRAKRKAEAARAGVRAFPAAPPDPVGALAAWAETSLVVPAGHPAAGQPMALPGFAVDFLRAGWGAHESALSIARKNAIHEQTSPEVKRRQGADPHSSYGVHARCLMSNGIIASGG